MNIHRFSFDSDFVDSFINRVVLQIKLPNSSISRDAIVFEGCVNLNTFKNRFSNCAEKRDNVTKFFESNPDVAELKAKSIENCGELISEAHSLVFLSHKDEFNTALARLSNLAESTYSLNSLAKCIENL